MSRKYHVKVIHISEENDNEVTIDLDGKELKCFIVYCPYEINCGEDYPVEFSYEIFQDYSIRQIEEQTKDIQKVGDDYSYILQGKLLGSTFDTGIKFEDDVLLTEFSNLSEKYVEIMIDRLDISFCKVW